MTNVEISNPENSTLASDVLGEVAQLADNRGISTTVHSTGSDGSKGEILNTIILGMTSSAAYDLLKAVVTRLASRRDYKGTACVKVDGILIEFEDFLSAADRPDP